MRDGPGDGRRRPMTDGLRPVRRPAVRRHRRPVGSRLFLIQCRRGETLLTLKVEKQQVAAMAELLARVVKDQQRPGTFPTTRPSRSRRIRRGPSGPSGSPTTRPRTGWSWSSRNSCPRARWAPSPGVDHPGTGRRLLHPGHPARRVRSAALPPVRLAARPLRTRMPPDQRPPSTGRVSGGGPDRSVAGGGRRAARHP